MGTGPTWELRIAYRDEGFATGLAPASKSRRTLSPAMPRQFVNDGNAKPMDDGELVQVVRDQKTADDRPEKGVV